MRYPHGIRPRRDSPATRQASSVLRWLVPRLQAAIHQVSDDQERRRLLQALQIARQRTGPVARARAFPAGPKLPVSGTGDEAHGHTRVEAVVREMVIPMIAARQLEQGLARQLVERLRGQFARQYQQVSLSLAEAYASPPEEKSSDGLDLDQ
jgi:hypothetical protein